jgi:3-mercaptopyruvate sulfurtransferase SseA
MAAAAFSSPPTAALLDVRIAGEFDGIVLIAPDTRDGHIPGAQNLPIAGFFAPDNPTELMSPEPDLRRPLSRPAHHRLLPGWGKVFTGRARLAERRLSSF